MNNPARILVACLLVLGLALNFAPVAMAQTVTATLTGTVSDQSGALVPNVKVIATNQGTKIEYTAPSNDSGVYTIPFLPIGTYVVTGEASGFKKVVTNPIKLEVNQTARVDVKLELGEVTQTIEVQGVAPILQTESTTVGQLISGTTTVNLPLNGRNFQQLTLLVPGAITPNPGSFAGAAKFGGGGRPYVNGNRQEGNSFLLDGVDMNETIDNRISFYPNVDAIAEFKIETNNSSAEFGNVTGAIVNTNLKSGTNNFHGNVFEFIRNDALDANRWANNRSGAPKQKLRDNVFGATFGGPIIRNKTFFFGDYQGERQRTGGGATASVAPAEWRRGDLSSLTTVIRDPVTGQPFPGNQIPVARIVNPVARALFADPTLYPLPNRNVGGVVGNYVTTTASSIRNDQWDVKIDHRITEKDNFSGKFSFGDYNSQTPQGVLPTNPTSQNDTHSRNLVLNWNHTFSPSVVNEARFGFNRVYIVTAINDWGGLGAGNAKVGIPGSQAIDGVSSVTLGNGLTGIGTAATVERNAPNTFQYGDNLSIARGKHFLKIGGQWLRYQQNRFYPGNNGLLGVFRYTGAFTGSEFADFLLDQLQSKGRGSQTGTWGHRQNRIGVFFQDDWKMKSNFTLNLGMRWEYTSPVVEVKDRQSNFDIATGRQLFAGRDGNSRALYEPFHKGFEPIFGFAWTPEMFGNKLVVRGGYRITQYMEGTGSNLRLPLNPPFFFESEVVFDPLTTGPGTITRGFTDVLPLSQVSGQVRIWNPNLRPQFTQQWNFTLEYQLSNTTSLSAGYVAHKASHLVVPTEYNQPLPDPGPTSTWRPQQQRRPLYPFQPLITTISGTDSSATSDYHSLQMSMRKRLSGGFEFMGSYTLSKAITDNTGYYGAGAAGAGAYWANTYDRHADRGLTFFDATHNFVWSGTYDMPFGKGRTWGNDMHPVANAILGGWNVSSIISLRTGFPITVTNADRSLQAQRGGQRPNRIASGEVSNQTLEKWIDIAAFTQPDLGAFGNSGVSILRQPSLANWDFGLGKKFSISESKYFEFRSEFFNFSNHPSYQAPGRAFNTPNTFGLITSTISEPRNIQFGLKFFF